MSVIIHLLLLLSFCILLIKSSTWLVISLSKIARILEWSEFWVTFFLMAFATSLPEFFVGVSSGVHQVPQLSFGNILGSNLINLTLGVGLVAFLAKGIKIKSDTVKKESILTAAFASLPLILLLDGALTRIDAFILLLVVVFYLKRIIKEKKQFKKVFDSLPRQEKKFKKFISQIGIFLLSVFLLLISAEGVVRNSMFLAEKIGVSYLATGILFISLGTVLPELTFGVRAISLGHKRMALGNFMGTIVINSTFILATVIMISPLTTFYLSPYAVGIVFTLIASLSFVIFAKTHNEITKKEAFILGLIYLSFLIAEVILG